MLNESYVKVLHVDLTTQKVRVARRQDIYHLLGGVGVASALYEEVMGYRVGGIIARKAVVTSPQRRLDLSLRLIAQDIFSSSFKKKKSFSQTMAEELITIASNDPKNFVIRERTRIEREAEGAR